MVTPLRVVFFGTPAFAVPTLEHLHRSSHTLVAVITQPDRPRGRGQKLVPGEVKARALELGVPVLQPARLKDEDFLSAFGALGADLGVVAAYGRILSQRLLDMPRLGMINVHASLLPRWRGAAPIHRAVLAGDKATGVTIMRMVQALDAGPSLATEALLIGPNETSAELERRLAAIGGPLLVQTVDRLAAGPVPETPQPEDGVTYAERLDRRDSRVDWNRPASAVHDHIRGVQPWPLAAVILNGKRVLLTRSETLASAPQPAAAPGTIVGVSRDGIDIQAADGCVRITGIQPEGRPAMSVRDFLNGRRVEIGDRVDALPDLP